MRRFFFRNEPNSFKANLRKKKRKCANGPKYNAVKAIVWQVSHVRYTGSLGPYVIKNYAVNLCNIGMISLGLAYIELKHSN